MKNMFRTFFVLAIPLFALTILALNAPVAFAEKHQLVDDDLSSKYVDFERFVQSKVEQLNRNHNVSRSRMKITRLDDGTYRARYHQIDDSSLKVKVRRSQSDSIPYVGVLAYQEQVLECSAKSPEQFADSGFSVVKIIPNRHIFSYQKGGWN
jgi:hypothetical protein